MTPAEYYAEEHRNLLRASNATLAKTVRNQHAPDCPCHEDNAITEPINQQDTE